MRESLCFKEILQRV